MKGHMESLAEINYRMETGKIKARPTSYRGIEFRSRLEVRYAWYLDDIGERWRYEPRVYGPKGRGYLPDFEILGRRQPTFIEVKPTIAEAPDALAKMAVIWDTHPDALLIVACEEGWTYYAALQGWDPETWHQGWAA